MTNHETVAGGSDGAGWLSNRRGRRIAAVAPRVRVGPVEPVHPPEPTDVTAKRADKSATVAWDLPETAAAVTDFEVSRTPGDETYVVPAGARSYRDTGLVNGTAYTYSVRTLTTDESSAAVEAPPVVPATVPTPPGIVSVKAGKHDVTVTWTKPQARGSAVTGYRLVCLGRVVKVGPGRLRATISGLPSGKRLRVGIRACNDVGPSRTAYTKYVTTHPSPLPSAGRRRTARSTSPPAG